MDNDIDISDLNLDDKVAILMRDLPEPVQNFLKSPERNDVSLQLSRKYNLHTDTAGIFEKSYIFMLLGVHSPDEFVQELRDGGINEETIKGLATDVNELVFKKLREEERAGTPAAPAEAPKPPQVPVMGIEIKNDIPPNLPGQYAAPQPIAPPPAPVPPPQPVAPPAYVPPPAPVYQTPPSAPAIPIYSNPQAPAQPAPQPILPAQPYIPAARTMERDVEMAMQGPRPETQPAPSFVPPAPAPVPQAPTPPPAAPNYPPPAMASVHLTPVDRAYSNAPITKEYGNDPYREPIE